jgi:hypothetical protein
MPMPMQDSVGGYGFGCICCCYCNCYYFYDLLSIVSLLHAGWDGLMEYEQSTWHGEYSTAFPPRGFHVATLCESAAKIEILSKLLKILSKLPKI